MFVELAKSAIEFLKLAPRYLIAVAIVSGVLLFLPDTWLQRIGLNTFATANRQWLGLTFLVSAVLWGVSAIATCWDWVAGKFFRRRVRKHIAQKLCSLTEDEKQILRYYFAKGTRANMLKVDDGVVQGLVANRIIYRSASMGNILEGFAHNITDVAWDYIHANPHILQGTTNTYRTDKQERYW
ncbi:superinfection exclusion B family protein [Bordetella trematum]|uniref:superinfection exclusion B family protein n=1 Tax=Bordetella trematum TaxID=123899 RepID=UPI0013FE4E2A|nr:superinfection exclusion B family protein [Bordetella trematum]